MTAEELLDRMEKDNRTEDVQMAVFYGVPGFTVIPCRGTAAEKDGHIELTLHPAGSDQSDTMELGTEEIRKLLGISPERLLSHPEHLMVSEVREGSAYQAVITYDRTSEAERRHMLAILEEFISWTGIDTEEKLLQAAQNGRERLRQAEEEYRKKSGKLPGPGNGR